MMEYPESYTLARQIKKTLIGKGIRDVIVLKTPHKFAFIRMDTTLYPDHLIGQKITGATNRGGMLEIHTDDSMIVFSDGITPVFYQDRKSKAFPKKHQLALIFDDDSALACTIRMYGAVDICPLGKCTESYYISSSTKENPMTKGFTYPYFRSLLPNKGKLSAKAFLATEQRIPGIGNGILQDILWDAGIDPRYDMIQASEEDFRTLYDSTVKIIKEACKAGGRDTENNLFGHKGGYVTRLSKNTLGKPCPRCGSPLQKTTYMGGTVYFCEKCQKR